MEARLFFSFLNFYFIDLRQGEEVGEREKNTDLLSHLFTHTGWFLDVP